MADLFESSYYNLGQNLCRLFHFVAQLVFTTSETELDYYHQKVNIRVSSRVVERLKTEDLRKLGELKKIPEMLGSDSKHPTALPKAKLRRLLAKHRKTSAVKHFIEKLIWLKFVNL